ncbi:A24 family peptidase [Micromonospora sp. NPDC023966]|uniref:A24 family peptidase n=1 Tax=Micromonospora sp. NPDC023966 TaxID=3154699 RepID=UPI0033C0995A
MSAGLVAGVALLGALAGRAAVPLARRFIGPPAPPRALDSSGVLPPPRPGEVAAVAATCVDRAALRHGVPLVGAVLFAGLAARGADSTLPALLLVAAVGLVLALVDLICLRLPDPLVGAAALGGGLGLVGAALVTGTPGRLPAALAGAAVSFAGYVLLAVLPRSRVGFGDVKLAAALGLPLGWLGWPALGLGLLLPHVLNGVVVLALLAAGRVRRDTAVPFGPAILAGAWLAVLLA